MFKKIALILAVVALVAAAGTVPGVGHYSITLVQATSVQGTVLKAGDYQLRLVDQKLTITSENGKNLMEISVKVQTQDKKFDRTVVQTDNATGKPVVSEIRLGGTKTKLILN
jgi:hypothetical protein